jgi:hypothetical protein
MIVDQDTVSSRSNKQGLLLLLMPLWIEGMSVLKHAATDHQQLPHSCSTINTLLLPCAEKRSPKALMKGDI